MNYSTSQLNNLDTEEFLEHLDCVSDTTLLSIIKRYKATLDEYNGNVLKEKLNLQNKAIKHVILIRNGNINYRKIQH